MESGALAIHISKALPKVLFLIVLQGLVEVLTSILFSQCPAVMFGCLDFFLPPREGYVCTHLHTYIKQQGALQFKPLLNTKLYILIHVLSPTGNSWLSVTSFIRAFHDPLQQLYGIKLVSQTPQDNRIC